MQSKKNKTKVNWTIDPEVVEAVREKAEKLTVKTGVKFSESAAANAMLKEQVKRDEN